MKKSIFTLAAVSAAIAPAIQATETSPIIVTATRTAQTADQSLASVTVITRDEIEKSTAQSVDELLSRQTSFDFSSNGGYGKQTSMFLRGTNSSHTLVLINGIKAGSVSAGTTALQLLPLDQIERIEIVRGPRSSLYGSEAAGGVVQIFTRQGGDKAHTTFQTGAGSNQLRRDAISTSGPTANGHYSISLASLETEGFDAKKPTSGFWGVDEPDNDGYTNQSATLSLQHNFANGVEMDLDLMHAQGNTEYDSTTADSSTDYAQQAAGITFSYSISERWFSQLTIGETRDENDTLTGGMHEGSSFYSRRTQYNWQNDVTLNENNLVTVGIDYTDDKLVSSSSYTKTTRSNTAVFAQLQSAIKQHNYQLNLRKDDNEAFGNETTGSIAWGYTTASNLRLTASYGTAFIAPDFNDLYWQFDGWFEGNPNLKPENSKTLEFGLSGQYSKGHWSTNVFKTEVDNLIVYNPTVTPNTMNNINKAEIEGIELELTAVLGNWNTTTQVSLLDPIDKETKKQLHRRTKNSLNFDINREFGETQFGANILAQSQRYDDPSNTTPMSGYGFVSLYASTALTKHWQASIEINNANGKDYETAATYNTAGRTAFVSVRYDTF